MSYFIITYNHNRNGAWNANEADKKRESLEKTIINTFFNGISDNSKSMHLSDFTWFIQTELESDKIYSLLIKYFHAKDDLVVAKLGCKDISWLRHTGNKHLTMFLEEIQTQIIKSFQDFQDCPPEDSDK